MKECWQWFVSTDLPLSNYLSNWMWERDETPVPPCKLRFRNKTTPWRLMSHAESRQMERVMKERDFLKGSASVLRYPSSHVHAVFLPYHFARHSIIKTDAPDTNPYTTIAIGWFINSCCSARYTLSLCYSCTTSSIRSLLPLSLLSSDLSFNLAWKLSQPSPVPPSYWWRS